MGEGTTREEAEQEQYHLALSFDATAEDSNVEHSTRRGKKQKIKNFGLLGQRSQTITQVDSYWNVEAQQIFRRYLGTPESTINSVVDSVASVDRRTPAGAVDWLGWQRRFSELLLKARFVPHPRCYASAGQGLEFPLGWTYQLQRERAQVLTALQKFVGKPGVSSLRVQLGEVDSPDALRLLEFTSQMLASYTIRTKRPPPQIQAILPLTHGDLSAFLRLKHPSQKAKWQRSHAVELPEDCFSQFDVYEPVLVELHDAIVANRDFDSVYFRSSTNSDSILHVDRVPVGAFNLGSFVDPVTKQFNWPVLEESLETALRFIANWKVVSNWPTDHLPPVLTLMGWEQALESMQVPYGSDLSFALAERVTAKLQRSLQELLYRLSLNMGHKTPIVAPLIVPSQSSFSAMMGNCSVGALSRKGDVTPEQQIRMQAQFFGNRERKTIASVHRARKLNADQFIAACRCAAELNFVGIRFRR